MRTILYALLVTSMGYVYAGPPTFDVNIVNTPVPVEGTVELGTPVSIDGTVDVDVTTPVTIDGPVDVNVTGGPLPVSVEQVSREPVRSITGLSNVSYTLLDAEPVEWVKEDAAVISEMPEGYALYITDVIVSWNRVTVPPPADAPFGFAFIALTDDGNTATSELFLSGTGLPYSHSFTTPLSFPSINLNNGELGLLLTSDTWLVITMTGYLEPLSE